jgi:hypothetical protein
MFIGDVLSKRTLGPTLPLMDTSLCPLEPLELGTYLGSSIYIGLCPLEPLELRFL